LQFIKDVIRILAVIYMEILNFPSRDSLPIYETIYRYQSFRIFHKSEGRICSKGIEPFISLNVMMHPQESLSETVAWDRALSSALFLVLIASYSRLYGGNEGCEELENSQNDAAP
jgi:uncharacterized membrane protein